MQNIHDLLPSVFSSRFTLPLAFKTDVFSPTTYRILKIPKSEKETLVWLIKVGNFVPCYLHSNFYYFFVTTFWPLFCQVVMQDRTLITLCSTFSFSLSLLQTPVSLLYFMVGATASSYVTHTLVTNPLERKHISVGKPWISLVFKEKQRWSTFYFWCLQYQPHGRFLIKAIKGKAFTYVFLVAKGHQNYITFF